MKRLLTIYLCLAVVLVFSSCSKKSDQGPTLPNTDQYITWNFNGKQGALTSPNDSTFSIRADNDTHLVGYSAANRDHIFFIVNGDRQAGAFETVSCTFDINETTYEDPYSSMRINITEYGAIGGYITGTYSGNITQSTSSPVFAVSGNFKLKIR